MGSSASDRLSLTYGRSHQRGRRLLTTLEIESMWIRSLLHVITAVVAPAATADVTVQHVVSPVVSNAEAKAAPGVPTDPAAIDWNRDDHSGKIQIARSFAPALRGRVGAISEAVLATGKTNNKRRMQKDAKQEKKDDIFQKDAAKTRAHLEKIAEMELKNRVKEANEAAKAAEKEESERIKAEEKAAELAAKAGAEQGEDVENDEEASTDAEDLLSHFLEPETETESATETESEAEDLFHIFEPDTVPEPEAEAEDKDFLMSEPNTMPEPEEEAEDLFYIPEPETKVETMTPELETDADHFPGPEIRTETERSRQVPNLNSSQSGIRNMTPGGKFGMSLVFISLFALILVAAFRSRSRRTSKGEKYWEMNDQADEYDVTAVHSRSRRNRKRGKYWEMDDQTDGGPNEFFAKADTNTDTNTNTNTDTDINVEAMEELDDIIDHIATAPTQGTDEGFEIW